MATSNQTLSTDSEDLLKSKATSGNVTVTETSSESRILCVCLSWMKLNWKKIIESVVLSSIIFLVWCLFAIPTIFYALERTSPSNNKLSDSTNKSDLCIDQPLDDNTTDLCLNVSGTRETTNFECDEGFSLHNSRSGHNGALVCVALCDYWLSASETLGDTITEAVSMSLAVLSSLAVIFLALWPQKDNLLVYPTVYLVYICLTVAVICPFLLTGILGKESVFCHADNLLRMWGSATPFCTTLGVVFTYGLMQISLWILFHAIGIFLGVAFPFFYRKLKTEGKIKFIHIFSVVLAVVYPAVPAFLFLIDGYGTVPSSLDTCTGKNRDVSYFTLILPITVILASTTTTLIIIFWKILKAFSIKRKDMKKAQMKILMIMCYYILIGTVLISTYTFILTTNGDTIDSFQSYFTCQSGGVQPNVDCGESPTVEFRELTLLPSVSITLLGLLPPVILVFTASCKFDKTLCKK